MVIANLSSNLMNIVSMVVAVEVHRKFLNAFVNAVMYAEHWSLSALYVSHLTEAFAVFNWEPVPTIY